MPSLTGIWSPIRAAPPMTVWGEISDLEEPLRVREARWYEACAEVRISTYSRIVPSLPTRIVMKAHPCPLTWRPRREVRRNLVQSSGWRCKPVMHHGDAPW